MQENKHLKYTITIKKADLIVFWKVFYWKLEEDFLMIFIYFQLLILIIFSCSDRAQEVLAAACMEALLRGRKEKRRMVLTALLNR